MFYGAGAGKLPTASAVVADIIDEVKHLDRNITIQWSKNKLKLGDFKNSKKQFFVRVAGNVDERKNEMEKLFGVEHLVTIGKEDEFGFITCLLSEGEFEEKAKHCDGMITRIRLTQ